MKFLNTLGEISASFVAKEHSVALGNCESCKMFLHIHPSAELLLVTRGEMTVHILGRESEKISEGECAFIFPFQSHSYERPEGTEYFRFNFLPSLVRSFFAPNEMNTGDKSVFSININEYGPFLECVRSGCVSVYKVKGFLYSMIGDYCAQTTFTAKHIDDNVLSKVISYIDAHKSERISLRDTAQALGYNEKYLSRCINQSAGFGFSTLLSTLRTDLASYLLKNTDRTIVDIAIECGFGSERTFYRQFKLVTGLTPSEYRASVPHDPIINDAVL